MIPVTEHAQKRFQERYPPEEMPALFAASYRITPEMAGTMTASNRRMRSKDSYLLTPDFSGIFVVVDNIVITFLRFSKVQTELARHVWGVDERVQELDEEVPKPSGRFSDRRFKAWLRETLGGDGIQPEGFYWGRNHRRYVCKRIYGKAPRCDGSIWVWDKEEVKVSKVRGVLVLEYTGKGP